MAAGRYQLLLTAGAEQDLESIYDYIAEIDSPANTEHDAFFNSLLILNLASNLERTHARRSLAVARSMMRVRLSDL